ncbi:MULTISPECIES: DUF6544 family protein [Halorussus]|uniref:DUF6920 family protein n=1 Tax=Halorussus TaxID=1070314 RepID=UPI000E21201D|nr:MULTISPECIES: DUF6544 family protein [Halorussus]NHN61092.1 hypothetical protein [Halorussus sp. JP-T4]
MRRNAALKLLGALGAGAAAVRVAEFRRDRTVARRVDDLLSAADRRSGETFSADDLDGLPDPVRRYFETVLDEGQPSVRSVRLEQRGEFRLGGATGSWKPLAATQHFTVDPPGFVWDAEIELFPLVSTRVVDAYAAGEGSLRATVLGAIPVAEAEPSPALNEGELLRYLAEAVWFPTALLPGRGVTWEAVDDRSARATVTDRGTTASLVFRFDDRNRVERVHAEGRYRAEDDAFVPWTGYFRDYRERNGMEIPTAAEVEWNLPEGDSSYWRASVTEIDHRTGRGDADFDGDRE